MLGRELKLPIDLLCSRPEENDVATPYVQTMQERMEEVHQFTRERLQLASDRMNRYYDAAVRETSYKRGDPVWLYSPQRKKGLSPKLQRPWQGPFLVLQKINDVVYRIQLSPRIKPKIVHHNRLTPYQGQTPPSWLEDPPGGIQERTTHEASTARNRGVEANTHPGRSLTRHHHLETSPPSLRRSDRQRAPPNSYGQ